MKQLDNVDGAQAHSRENKVGRKEKFSFLVLTAWFVGMLGAVAYSIYFVGAIQPVMELGAIVGNNYGTGVQGAIGGASGTATDSSGEIVAYNATIESLYAAATIGAELESVETRAATAESDAVAETPTPVGLVGCPNVTSVNVRNGPGTSHSAIGYILDGDCVTVRGRNDDGDWIRIYNAPRPSSDGGWVAAELMTVDGSISQLDLILTN